MSVSTWFDRCARDPHEVTMTVNAVTQACSAKENVVANVGEAVAVQAGGPAWWSLDCLVVEVSSTGDAGPLVYEMTLPDGASPPLHVHADLDDSFYVLDGRMVVRCGGDVQLAAAGSWVPFPRGVPHTFRVMGGPAR